MNDVFRVSFLISITLVVIQLLPGCFSRLSRKLRTKTQENTNISLESFQLRAEVTKAVKDGLKEAPENFDAVVWPKLKEKLCPKMVPNIDLVKTRLFHLARERIGISPTFEKKLATKQEEDDVFKRFFDFHVGVFTFTSKNDDKNEELEKHEEIVGYVPIWKCANEQLRVATNEGLAKHFDMRIRNIHMIPKRTRDEICWVTAVRDPISHFLSGYNEIETRFVNRGDEHFNDYVFSRYVNGSKERFEMFVYDFLSGMKLVTNPSHPLLVEPLDMPHIYLMSGILVELARNNVTLTSYLPSLHNLTLNWPHFVSSTCPSVTFPASFEATPLKFTGQHESSLDKIGYHSAAKEVWLEGDLTAQALCILHVMDYACFNKLKIPPLCREVYNEKDFRKAIVS